MLLLSHLHPLWVPLHCYDCSWVKKLRGSNFWQASEIACASNLQLLWLLDPCAVFAEQLSLTAMTTSVTALVWRVLEVVVLMLAPPEACTVELRVADFLH